MISLSLLIHLSQDTRMHKKKKKKNRPKFSLNPWRFEQNIDRIDHEDSNPLRVKVKVILLPKSKVVVDEREVDYSWDILYNANAAV